MILQKNFFKRVDVQVSLLAVSMMALSGILIFNLVYSMSYKQMIDMLETNVNSLAAHIDENIDSTIFTEIKTKEDMGTQKYLDAQAFLDRIRNTSKVKYLYTAVINKENQLIYHVDGLPFDDADFRNVGDLIESEFQEPLLKALNNEIVMHEDILSTEWGNVFVAYYPIHNEQDEVVAALGVEFPAESQYSAFRNIRLLINTVMILMCTFSWFLSTFLFRRISNPHFKDIYNTDSLTQLKNRNAFDTDIHNFIHTKQLDNITLVITDLNGLKPVNDKLGHKMGDFYIYSCARALLVDDMNYNLVYRIGGDEFATIIPSDFNDKGEYYINAVRENLKNLCKNQIPSASVSMGYAQCAGTTLESWEKVYYKADEQMYKDKKEYYKNNKILDERK